MNFRIPALIALLIISGIGCDPCRCPQALGFFDIKGISESFHRDITGRILPEGDSLAFNDWREIQIHFLVDYVATQETPGLIQNPFANSLYACSCVDDGWNGSKNESILNVTVVSLNDYDSLHLASDTLNDIAEWFYPQQMSLADFNGTAPHPVEEAVIGIGLNMPPVINKEVRLKVYIELNNSESYVVEAPRVVLY